ncbi:unnamed protein product, partial [Ectocarpus fasciculatus]
MRLGAWATAAVIAASQAMLSAAFLATSPPPSTLQLLRRPSPAAASASASSARRSEFQLDAMAEDSMLSRSGLLAAGLKAATAAVAASAAAAGAVGVSPASAAGVEPEVTSKCFIEVRIMEPLNEANGYSSKNAFKGRLVFGVYGKESPKAAENFLRYVRADRSNGEPSYASGQLTKMEPGVFLEGGKIAGLNIINIGGQEELEYGGEVVAPLPSLLEASSGDRPHDRRGLLTRDRLSRGPEFGVTLGAAPALDGSHEVFGRLLQGEDVLARLENVPVYGGQSRLEEGSLASDAFKAQN